MKSIKTTVGVAFVLGLVMLLAATPASALTVVGWDGSGSPAAVGFNLTGSTLMHTFNSDDGIGGSAPGFMHQADITASNTDGHWSLAPNLDNTEGWFTETRFQVISNDGDDSDFGVSFNIWNTDGRLWTRFNTLGFRIGGSGDNVSDESHLYPGAGPFHTFRVECAAGCTRVDAFMDGVFINDYQMGPVSGAANLLTFGDASIQGSGEAIWDYTVLNVEIEDVLPTPTADFNSDNLVDGADFLAWQRGFGATGTPGTLLGQGDADHNGTVDGLDLGVWESRYSASAITAATAAVPEPSSLVLLLAASVLLVVRRQRD